MFEIKLHSPLVELKSRAEAEAAFELKGKNTEVVYPKKRNEAAIIELSIVDYSVYFLQGVPPSGYELHCLLVPAV